MKRSGGFFLVVTLALSGCSRLQPDSESADVTEYVTITTTPRAAPEPVPSASTETSTESGEVGIDDADLSAIVDRAVAVHGGSAAIAISNGQSVAVGGSDLDAPAWSTIKVPLALAALRDNPAQYDNAVAAITESNNSAASALWESLGTPSQAALSVESVLSEAGSPIAVNTEVLRPEFSVFGQTLWSTTEQATFAANLACVRGADRIIELMGNIDASQNYGLTQLAGASSKSGWGPNEAGAYDVRQLALISNSSGTLGVALTASPGTGTYEAAQSMSTQLAQELVGIIDQHTAGKC
ncbi:hypothetical protein ACXZ66_04830 [Corynebacterium sp. S7]